MPTLRSYTHLQATQADKQAKACKRVYLPNRTTETTGNQADEKQHLQEIGGLVLRLTVLWWHKHSFFV